VHFQGDELGPTADGAINDGRLGFVEFGEGVELPLAVKVVNVQGIEDGTPQPALLLGAHVDDLCVQVLYQMTLNVCWGDEADLCRQNDLWR